MGAAIFPLIFLSGGVTESPGSCPADSYPSETNFIANSQRNATAEIRLDGTPTTAPEQGEGGNTNVYYQPSVEVIQEFKVSNNAFSSEFGNNCGTVRQHSSEGRGGIKFHGSWWWSGQRSGLDANDFFSNAGGLSRPNHKHDDFGFMVDGHIRNDKTFFLFDLERVNVFNRTRFGLPKSAFGDSLFGNVNSLAPGFTPRRMQLVARLEF